MTSLEEILSNFSFAELEKPGSRYPKFGKAGRKDFIFTCKRCGSQRESMKFTHNIPHKWASHLARYCRPSSTSQSEQEEEQMQQQGPAE